MQKVALITGAGSGLGRQLATDLSREKWFVVASDIDKKACDETHSLLETGISFTLDTTKLEDWQMVLSELSSRSIQVDLFINNAGVSSSGAIGDFSLEKWRSIFEINFWGYLNGLHIFLPHLKANPKGAHIVNVASIAAILSAPRMGCYAATKAAVLSLSETLYTELWGTGIGVTVVCPSFFQSSILTSKNFLRKEERQAALHATVTSSLSVEKLSRKILLAIASNQLYVVEPLITGWCFWLLKRLMPVFFLNLIRRRTTKALSLRIRPTRLRTEI